MRGDVPADQVRGRGLISGHGLDVEVQDEVGMVDPVHDLDRFRTGVDEVGFRRTERLQANPYPAIGDAGHGTPEGVHGVVHRLRRVAPAGMRRCAGEPKTIRLAAQVPAAAGQLDEIIGGPAAHGLFRRRDLKPLGLRQQPVQPEDGDTAVLGLAAQPLALFRGARR